MRINASSGTPSESAISHKQIEDKIPEIDGQDESQIREIANFLWLNEGCPDGRADDHWMVACGMLTVSLPATAEQEFKTSTPMGDPLPDMPIAPESPAKR